MLRTLGPGLITGAADDDPSGIATYTQTGAQFGYGQLWTAVLMLPFMTAIQEACARIGAVTGKGIAAVVKQHYSATVLYITLFLVVIANTINIGADLGAMGAAAHLLVPVPFAVLTLLFTAIPYYFWRYSPVVQSVREDVEVVRAGASFVSDHTLPGAPALGDHPPCDLRAPHRIQLRISFHHHRRARHHHLPVHVLLGRPRKRRKKSVRNIW